jgi:hypothetical protein
MEMVCWGRVWPLINSPSLITILSVGSGHRAFND